MNHYDKLKEDLLRMTYLVDFIKKTKNKEYIKEAKLLRKDIKVQLNAILKEFEAQETDFLEAVLED